MRLKLFEEYSKYYLEVSRSEFFDGKFESRKIFTDYEIEKISSYFPKDVSISKTSQTKDNLFDVHLDKSYHITISKGRDEYYFVHYFPMDYVSKTYSSSQFYKCDQWDGLLKWLEYFKDKLKY